MGAIHLPDADLQLADADQLSRLSACGQQGKRFHDGPWASQPSRGYFEIIAGQDVARVYAQDDCCSGASGHGGVHGALQIRSRRGEQERQRDHLSPTFTASATVIMTVSGSTGEAINPYDS